VVVAVGGLVVVGLAEVVEEILDSRVAAMVVEVGEVVVLVIIKDLQMVVSMAILDFLEEDTTEVEAEEGAEGAKEEEEALI